MNLKTFHQELHSTILWRGKEYYNQGAVTSLEEKESGVWNATVKGSEPYSVEVEVSKRGEIDSFFCDCPHDADVCKHIVAVFFELRERSERFIVQPVKETKGLTFAELLKKVSVAELKQFVELYAHSDKNFKEQFQLHFAHKDEQIDVEKKYSDLVKKKIRAAQNRGFVDYYSAGDLSGALDSVLANSRQALQTGNFKDAIIIAQVILKQLADEVLPNADDSDGDLGNTMEDAAMLLKEIAESNLCARELKENLHGFLSKELNNDIYFEYGDYGTDLFEVFRYLSVQLNKAELFLSFAYQLAKSPVKPSDNDYHAQYLITQTILFFQETGNTEEAKKLIDQNLDIPEVRQIAIEETIENREYSKAKKLIHQGISVDERKGHPGTVLAWQKELLRIAILEGDIQTQRQYNLLFAFDTGFNPEYYYFWKKTFSDAEWDTGFSNLVEKITADVELEAVEHLNNHWWSKNHTLLKKLAPVYVEEKQWQQLFKLVEAYPSLDELLNYVKYLAPHFQPELTELLFPALIIAGDMANSRPHYAQIASNMLRIIKLMPRSKSKITEAAQVLRAKYPRRPAMIAELKVVK